MASLHQHAAVLLTFGLLIGCGGDRSRAGTGMDTTGAAAVTPDSAAMPTSDSASASRDTTPAAAPAATDTAKRPSAVAPAQTPPPAKSATRAAAPPAKKPAAAADRPAHDGSAAPTPHAATDSAPVPAGDSAKSASAAAPAAKPQQQDSSTQTAEAPLIDAYHQPPHDTVSEAVYDGWKQFNLNCARCHGEDALGTTIAPHLILSLKPDGPINTKELFVQTVCAGRPTKGMPSWCALGLGIDKINDIYLYVKGRSDAKISPGRPAVKRAG
jgi:cbb3-type cytochrome c oxidase subunit III